MERILDSWYSPSLNKNMEIAMYGHYGFALLLIPTAAADYLEYERFLLLDVIEPYISAGKGIRASNPSGTSSLTIISTMK